MNKWSTARRVPAALAIVGSMLAVLVVATQIHYVYFDRHHLPDLGPFIRFELPTIGHIYDADGRSLIELARRVPRDHEVRRDPACRS